MRRREPCESWRLSCVVASLFAPPFWGLLRLVACVHSAPPPGGQHEFNAEVGIMDACQPNRQVRWLSAALRTQMNHGLVAPPGRQWWCFWAPTRSVGEGCWRVAWLSASRVACACTDPCQRGLAGDKTEIRCDVVSISRRAVRLRMGVKKRERSAQQEA
jgi:hypothetical protein